MSKKDEKRRKLRVGVKKLADEADRATTVKLGELKKSIQNHQSANSKHKKTNPRSKGGANKNNKAQASAVVKNTNEYLKAKKKSDKASAKATKYDADHNSKTFPTIEKTSMKALNDVNLNGMLEKIKAQGKVKEQNTIITNLEKGYDENTWRTPGADEYQEFLNKQAETSVDMNIIPVSVSTGEPEGTTVGASQSEVQGSSSLRNTIISYQQPAKELDAPADIANSTPVVPRTTTAETDSAETTREGGGTAEQHNVGGFGAREDKYTRLKKHKTKLRDPATPAIPPKAPAPVVSPGMSPDERDAQAEALRAKMMAPHHLRRHDTNAKTVEYVVAGDGTTAPVNTMAPPSQTAFGTKQGTTIPLHQAEQQSAYVPNFTTAEAQTASQTAQAPPIPASPEADPAMQPTADTTGYVNILQAQDTAGIPTTSKELFSGVGKESTTEGKSITQLKDDIKYFHSIYDKFIPEFNSTSHKKKREEALKTKNIALVKIHYNEMEASIRKFYQDQSGLKLGVVISAESYIQQFLSQQSSPWPQPAQPTPPVVDEPVNAPTGAIPTQPTGVRQAEGAYNTEGGDRVYRKTGDPYDFKSQEQQILATQGGLNRAAKRGMGQLLHAPPLKMATGYMGDSVLRQDDRTGYNRFLNSRVINRFPSNFKIKG